MSILLPKPAITPKQKRMALTIAAVADALQFLSIPAYFFGGYALDDVIDIAVAAVLLALFGFKWQFAIAFVLELFPIIDVCPTWTIFVATLPVERPDAVTAHTVTTDTVTAQNVSPDASPTHPSTVVRPPILTQATPDIIDAEVIEKK